jgi:hypothetical protein
MIMRRVSCALVATLLCAVVLRAALPASDAFDRANESPMGGNWTAPDGVADSKFLLVGDGAHGHVEGQGGATLNWMYWNADGFNTNHKSQVTISGGNSLTGAGSWAGVAVRIQATGQSGYYCGIVGGAYKLRRLDSGAENNLANITDTPTVGDVLRLEANSTTITCYINNVQKAQATGESTYSGGAPGLFGYQGIDAWEMDTWSGDDLSGGGGGGTRKRMPIGSGGLYDHLSERVMTAPAREDRARAVLFDGLAAPRLAVGAPWREPAVDPRPPTSRSKARKVARRHGDQWCGSEHTVQLMGLTAHLSNP